MGGTLQIRPGREAFAALAADRPLAPVWAELLPDKAPANGSTIAVLADVSTPVGLFPAVAGDGPAILLESVERSERWGRYSFVAGDPAAIVVAGPGGVEIRDVVRQLPWTAPAAGTPPR